MIVVVNQFGEVIGYLEGDVDPDVGGDGGSLTWSDALTALGLILLATTTL
jgi:hypothetical protein